MNLLGEKSTRDQKAMMMSKKLSDDRRYDVTFIKKAQQTEWSLASSIYDC